MKYIKSFITFFIIFIIHFLASAQVKTLVINKDQVLNQSYIGNGVQWSAYSTIDISETSKVQTVNVVFPSTKYKSIQYKFVYFEKDSPEVINGFPVAKDTIKNPSLQNKISLVIPADGVIVLTTMK